MDRKLVNQDVMLGGSLIALSVAALYFLRGNSPGTANAMGAAYLPRIVSVLLLLFGGIITVKGLLGQSEAFERFRPGAALAVLGGVVAFGLSIQPLGLFVAIGSCVLIGKLAGPTLSWRSALSVAVVLSAAVWLVFVYLLGIPIPVLPFWMA